MTEYVPLLYSCRTYVISCDEHFNQNPEVITKTLRKGLLEVKQTSPSFNNFSNHKACRRGSQFITGTCNRIQTKSHRDVSSGFSKVIAAKKTFWFTGTKSGSAPLVSKRCCRLLFRLDLYLWEQESKTLPTPPTTTIISPQSFYASWELGHTLLKLTLFSLKRQHVLNSKRTQICPSSEHILLIKQIAKKTHQWGKPKDSLFTAAFFLCQTESFWCGF